MTPERRKYFNRLMKNPDAGTKAPRTKHGRKKIARESPRFRVAVSGPFISAIQEAAYARGYAAGIETAIHEFHKTVRGK